MTKIGWFFVLLSAGLTVLANLLLRSGVDHAGGFAVELSAVHSGLLNLLRQPMFDLGLLLYALASIVWFRVLSTEPLSIAYPVLVSTTFMLVTLGAVLVFRESLNMYKLIGLVVIFAGIFIISRS